MANENYHTLYSCKTYLLVVVEIYLCVCLLVLTVPISQAWIQRKIFGGVRREAPILMNFVQKSTFNASCRRKFWKFTHFCCFWSTFPATNFTNCNPLSTPYTRLRGCATPPWIHACNIDIIPMAITNNISGRTGVSGTHSCATPISVLISLHCITHAHKKNWLAVLMQLSSITNTCKYTQSTMSLPII